MPEYVPTAELNILYNNRNITADISRHLLSFSYTDKVQGESDEIQITLDDVQGLWKGLWYPEKGATISATITYKSISLPCGSFSIDEIELSGPPDIVSIRALAAFVTKKVRTRHSTAHENKTLSEIVFSIAEKHDFKVAGSIPNVRFNRITQHRQTDLHFLDSLASAYGLVFSIRNKVITFTDIYELEGRPEILVLNKSQLTSYSLKDKISDTYKQAQVRYHNAANNELITNVQNATSADTSADDLEIRETTENKQQAEMKVRAALHRSNTFSQEGSISTEGNVLLVSGNNFRIPDLGVLSGLYHINEATHSIDRNSGYRTDVNIKRVGI